MFVYVCVCIPTDTYWLINYTHCIFHDAKIKLDQGIIWFSPNKVVPEHAKKSILNLFTPSDFSCLSIIQCQGYKWHEHISTGRELINRELIEPTQSPNSFFYSLRQPGTTALFASCTEVCVVCVWEVSGAGLGQQEGRREKSLKMQALQKDSEFYPFTCKNV